MEPAGVLEIRCGDEVSHCPLAGSLTIGRGANNAVVLNAPQVSRRHARIEWGEGGYRAIDLGSANGTRINGAPVTAAAPIRDGDRLELSDSTIEFQASAPTVAIVLPAPAGGLSIDPPSHEVRVQGQPLPQFTNLHTTRDTTGAGKRTAVEGIAPS